MVELEADTWVTALINDLGRLAQGLGRRIPKGNNTTFFIPRDNLTNVKTVTYLCIVAEIRPHKTETHCIQLTVGG